MTKNRCEVEVFSRVTGFFRPVQSWNKGKTEEFRQRKKYSLAQAAEKVDETSRNTKTVSY